MGAGKLQERDVVGSLWVPHVLLSKRAAHQAIFPSVTGRGLWSAGHPPRLPPATSLAGTQPFSPSVVTVPGYHFMVNLWWPCTSPACGCAHAAGVQ